MNSETTKGGGAAVVSIGRPAVERLTKLGERRAQLARVIVELERYASMSTSAPTTEQLVRERRTAR